MPDKGLRCRYEFPLGPDDGHGPYAYFGHPVPDEDINGPPDDSRPNVAWWDIEPNNNIDIGDMGALLYPDQQFSNTGPRYFRYNGDGLRTEQETGRFITSYVWDVAAGLPVILQDSEGNTYVYGLDLISRTDEEGVQTYHLYDGLGSTTTVADAAGGVVSEYLYDVFGELRGHSGVPDDVMLFTGEQYDARARAFNAGDPGNIEDKLALPA